MKGQTHKIGRPYDEGIKKLNVGVLNRIRG